MIPVVAGSSPFLAPLFINIMTRINLVPPEELFNNWLPNINDLNIIRERIEKNQS